MPDERSIEELVRAYGVAECQAALRVTRSLSLAEHEARLKAAQEAQGTLLRAVARLREENEGLARVVRWCHDNHGALVQELAALTPKGGDREPVA